MRSTRRLGVLGGTFDPIHVGHLDLGAAAEYALKLTDLAVVPASVPPHRPQPAASGFHRFAMAAMAIAGRPGWRVMDLELQEPGLSYTAVTLQRLHQQGYAPTELFFIAGADAFAEIVAWKDYPSLLERAHFAVVSRPGYLVDDLPQRLPALATRMVRATSSAVEGLGGARPPLFSTLIFLIDAATRDVSSTAIRRRSAAGQSIADLAHPAVCQHIEQHGLYSSPDSTAPGSVSKLGVAAGRLHGQD